MADPGSRDVRRSVTLSRLLGESHPWGLPDSAGGNRSGCGIMVSERAVVPVRGIVEAITVVACLSLNLLLGIAVMAVICLGHLIGDTP